MAFRELSVILSWAKPRDIFQFWMFAEYLISSDKSHVFLFTFFRIKFDQIWTIPVEVLHGYSASLTRPIIIKIKKLKKYHDRQCEFFVRLVKLQIVLFLWRYRVVTKCTGCWRRRQMIRRQTRPLALFVERISFLSRGVTKREDLGGSGLSQIYRDLVLPSSQTQNIII